MAIRRRGRVEGQTGFARALAGEAPLRLTVDSDHRLRPVVEEEKDDAPPASLAPPSEREEPENDPEAQLAEQRSKERLEELRREPYLDATVWAPVRSWKERLILAVVLLVPLLIAVATVSFPPLNVRIWRRLVLGLLALAMIAGVAVILTRGWVNRRRGREKPYDTQLPETEFRAIEDQQQTAATRMRHTTPSRSDS